MTRMRRNYFAREGGTHEHARFLGVCKFHHDTWGDMHGASFPQFLSVTVRAAGRSSSRRRDADLRLPPSVC